MSLKIISKFAQSEVHFLSYLPLCIDIGPGCQETLHYISIPIFTAEEQGCGSILYHLENQTLFKVSTTLNILKVRYGELAGLFQRELHH